MTDDKLTKRNELAQARKLAQSMVEALDTALVQQSETGQRALMDELQRWRDIGDEFAGLKPGEHETWPVDLLCNWDILKRELETANAELRELRPRAEAAEEEAAKLRKELDHPDWYKRQRDEALARAKKAEARESVLRMKVKEALALTATRKRFVMMSPLTYAQAEEMLQAALVVSSRGEGE